MADDSGADGRIETVPITEQISERVSDAMAELDVERGLVQEDTSLELAKPEAPLELAEMPERPPPMEPPMTDLEKAMRRSRRRKFLLGLGLVVIIAGGVIGFTDVGRSVLPKPMQGDAKRLAEDVERRAIEATSDSFYTFTDSDGVVHIVDRLEKVPEKYRKNAKKKY